jgi:hypothetical protein
LESIRHQKNIDVVLNKDTTGGIDGERSPQLEETFFKVE